MLEMSLDRFVVRLMSNPHKLGLRYRWTETGIWYTIKALRYTTEGEVIVFAVDPEGRQAVAEFHRCMPGNIFIMNVRDDLMERFLRKYPSDAHTTACSSMGILRHGPSKGYTLKKEAFGKFVSLIPETLLPDGWFPSTAHAACWALDAFVGTPKELYPGFYKAVADLWKTTVDNHPTKEPVWPDAFDDVLGQVRRRPEFIVLFGRPNERPSHA